MYDELVKRLNAYSAEHENHGGITAEAADAIEELSKPRWIPVKERLPNQNKFVLVRYRPTQKISYLKILRLEGEYWRDYDLHTYHLGRTTHWMPLPEPPKEET